MRTDVPAAAALRLRGRVVSNVETTVDSQAPAGRRAGRQVVRAGIPLPVAESTTFEHGESTVSLATLNALLQRTSQLNAKDTKTRRRESISLRPSRPLRSKAHYRRVLSAASAQSSASMPRRRDDRRRHTCRRHSNRLTVEA